MTDEPALRHELQRRAAHVSPQPDVADLVARLTHRSARRQRIAAAAVALSVVAGPVAGFAVARASDRPRPPRIAVDARLRGAFTPTPLPKAAPTTSPTVIGPSGSGTATRPGTDTPTGALGDGVAMGRLFARTSDDGTALRIYGARVDRAAGEAVPWWHPAPWCFPDRVLQVDASNDLIAGTTRGSLYAEPRDGLTVSRSFVGVNEQAPAWIAVVQTTKGVVARATFDDGGVDRAGLQGGVAVLSHRTNVATDWNALEQHTLHVDVLDATGAIVASRSVDGPDLVTIGGHTDDPECIPPAQLPAPGAEQPPDVAAATAAVTQTFENMFDGSLPPADHLTNIDDPGGSYAAAAQKLAASGLFAQQRRDSRAHVRGVVFTDATHAAVAFDITLNGTAGLSGQLGGAVLVDGRWKVDQGTGCALLANAGFPC